MVSRNSPGYPDRLFANREPRSARAVEPGVGADLSGRTVVGAAAELHTESEALYIKVFPRKPVAGNARRAHEPFPPAGGMANDETGKLIQIDQADRRGSQACFEGLVFSTD
jgi:hypothetical protein